MKAILVSVLISGLVGALAGAGLFAYFSDTESSEGNTFAAGTIDIELAGGGAVAYQGQIEFKPCETGYLEFTVTNVGSNDAYVWKHIAGVSGAENGVNEPECVAYGGTWTGTECQGGTPQQLCASDFEFDMYVSCDSGQTWAAIIPEEDPVPLTDVIGKYIPVGAIGAGEVVQVRQSFHLIGQTSNYAQSDKLVFDEEYYAQQIVGDPPGPPGEVYTPGVVGDNGTWSVKANTMPVPAGNMGVVFSSLDDRIYAIGGIVTQTDGSQTTTGVVRIYDPMTDSWQLASSADITRHAFGVALVNNRIYAIGGNSDEHGVGNYVEEYDIVGRSWQSLTWSAPDNVPRERQGMGAAVVNGRIYVIGGSDSSGARLDTVEEFTPPVPGDPTDTGSWREVASVPEHSSLPGIAGGVHGAAVVECNGRIYVIGGSRADSPGGPPIPVDWVFEFTPPEDPDDPTDLGSWRELESMAIERESLAAAVVGGGTSARIYAIGGMDQRAGRVDFCNVEEFAPPDPSDPSDDGSWRQVTSLNFARAELGAATATNLNKVYTLGGSDTNWEHLGRVEEFTPPHIP